MGFHVGVNTFEDLPAQVKNEHMLDFNDINQWLYSQSLVVYLLDENVSHVIRVSFRQHISRER